MRVVRTFGPGRGGDRTSRVSAVGWLNLRKFLGTEAPPPHGGVADNGRPKAANRAETSRQLANFMTNARTYQDATSPNVPPAPELDDYRGGPS